VVIGREKNTANILNANHDLFLLEGLFSTRDGRHEEHAKDCQRNDPSLHIGLVVG
jgi:hypothetical protein